MNLNNKSKDKGIQMNSRLYQQTNKIDLSSEVIAKQDGYVRAEVQQINVQIIKRGKRKMMTPLIAKYPVYGVIKTRELTSSVGLNTVMENVFSLQFHKFIKYTICSLMNEFGAIRTEESLYTTLQKAHKEIANKEISIPTLKKYMKLLKDAGVTRKIDNKTLVINPYQLYKDASIGGERLWQLQANWDIGKVMTHWLDLTNEERLELVRTKADLDKAWAEQELKDLGLPEKKVKILQENKKVVKKIAIHFIKHYYKESATLKLTIDSFIEYISTDKGARHFTSWWNKCYENDKKFGITFKLEYRQRNKYCKLIVSVLK